MSREDGEQSISGHIFSSIDAKRDYPQDMINSQPKYLSKKINNQTLNQSRSSFSKIPNSRGVKYHHLQAGRSYQTIHTNDYYNDRESIKYSKISQQNLQKIYQRKFEELLTLKIQKDELKLIQANNNQNNLQISLNLLKNKAFADLELHETIIKILNDTQQKQIQIKYMDQYQQEIDLQLSMINKQGQTMLNISQQVQLMYQNLEQQQICLNKILNQQKQKNAKQQKKKNQQILRLRISIKQKQQLLRNINQDICALYIRRHKQSNTPQKRLSASIKKFNNWQYQNQLQSQFVGNQLLKKKSQEIIDKVGGQQKLISITFQTDRNNNLVCFKCNYQNKSGQIHKNSKPQRSSSKLESHIINLRDILSLKIYFQHQIIGIAFQCRSKNQNGQRVIRIGNCSPYYDCIFINLIKKQLMTISSYWNQFKMIGLGIWYQKTNHKILSPTSLRHLDR